MIRVLVADDSRTVRELLVRILDSDPQIQVIGQATSGAEAVELAARLRPNVITMDIHMPIMDGLEATREIMTIAPTPIVIVSSHASRKDVALSLNATRAGALHVLRTPDNPLSPQFEQLRNEFLLMVKAMADVKVVRQWRTDRFAPTSSALRCRRTPRLIAIAASTGGPAALQQILAQLPRDYALPIVVVQHIAEGFANGLADWLRTNCDLRVRVAHHGDKLCERTVYIAPDRMHLGVAATGHIALSNAPPIGGFRPSGTHLFRSAAASFGGAMVAVILSGMGRDGVDGLKDVQAGGGLVLAQDEDSCIVFGMPREAIHAGVVDEVLPLTSIAARLVRLIDGDPHDQC
jgi:two-component system, chemotaxis family, protein-glutamate methylesterase/glutaminase